MIRKWPQEVGILEFWRSVYSSSTLFFLASLSVHSPRCDPYIFLILSIVFARKVSCRETKIKILLLNKRPSRQNLRLILATPGGGGDPPIKVFTQGVFVSGWWW